MTSDLRQRLSPDAWHWLVSLAPFSEVIHAERLPLYTEKLGLGRRRLTTLLPEWQAAGVLLPDPRDPAYLSLPAEYAAQLRAALAADSGRREAVERAFREHYEALASTLQEMGRPNESYDVSEALHTLEMEHENVESALRLALRDGHPLAALYAPLSGYWGIATDLDHAIELGQAVVAELERRDAAGSPQNAIELIAVLGALGAQFKFKGDLARARMLYERVLHLLPSIEGMDDEIYNLLAAAAHFQLGALAYAARNWNKAEYHFERMLELTEEAANPLDDAHAYLYLARIAMQRADWATAEEHLTNVLDIALEEDDDLLQAEVYQEMGHAAAGQQHWSEAEQHVTKALLLAYKLDMPMLQALSWQQLGGLADAQENWAEAEGNYRTAAERLVLIDEPRLAVQVYQAMVADAEQQHAGEREQEYLRAALRLAEQMADVRLQHLLLLEMGRRAARDGRWLKATKHLLQVLEGTAAAPDERIRRDALKVLGILWQDGHDTIAKRVGAVIGATPRQARVLLAAAAAQPWATAEPEPTTAKDPS